VRFPSSFKAAALSAAAAFLWGLPTGATAAPLATAVFPFAVGDTFAYQYEEKVVDKKPTGTTTTP